MKALLLPLFALATSAALLSTVSATVISGSVTTGSGSFIKLAVPFNQSNPDNTVGNNTFQTTNLYAFDEIQNINANVPIPVDIGGVGGVIAANTVVASHYIFFDPAGTASQTGWVDFDSIILGVATSTANLLASDIYQNNGVTYLNPGLRGLEAGDSVSIGNGALVGGRLNVDWSASTPGDYVRVFTAVSPSASVPDGGSMVMMFGSALLGLAGFKRLQNRK